MERAFNEWLLENTGSQTQPEDIAAEKPKFSYTIYGCMLLLPSGAFESPEWREAAGHHSSEDLRRLYRLIAKHLKVTHIAINKPIPALEENGQRENVIRAPINLTPLYGDFGPRTCSSPPSQSDFDSAFWVTAKQNGIFQTWAPRWTMFSRGNISEKARLISLPSVQRAVHEGKVNGKGCTAVDLYAGIGYFAFSYLRAGFSNVLCWDLNPWSIEGLRRGADANKWPSILYSEHDSMEDLTETDAKVLIFNESNENATKRIQEKRCNLPPVRHVNCGLLPTSHGSWQTALDVLDPNRGGWIHVHENFAIEEIEQKVQEVQETFQELVGKTCAETNVEVEHVNRLKSYAPGVMHCVLDIHIPPHKPG